MEEITIVTRREALTNGSKHYFTGKPCHRGHIAARIVSSYICVTCNKLSYQVFKGYHREYRRKHREKQKQYHAQWRNANREHYRRHQQEWARRNPEKRNEILRRYQDKLLVKIAGRLRTRLNRAIHSSAKTGSAVRDLGCSIVDFETYIRSRFSPEMSWSNWGTVWELDHIKPLMSFDLREREQLKQACYYTNLQPLLIEDHKRKTAADRAVLARF